MLIKLVGYAHKEGNFKDESGREVAFNSVTLDLLTDTPMDSDCVKSQNGMHCSTIKIKTSQLPTLFMPAVKFPADLNSWLNQVIRLEYSLLGAKPVLCGISLVNAGVSK